LVTNSSDRTLRQFTLPTYPSPSADGEYIEQELEPTHKFSDPINRTAWHAMSFSPDGEWLAGGAADPASHKIYIWDIANDGQLASTLDGGREPLIHVHVCQFINVYSDDLKYKLLLVAPEQAVNRLDYKSWKHSHLALPGTRTLGCFRRWF
jgi:WD40 repeat protein